jgi:hypothetical protein
MSTDFPNQFTTPCHVTYFDDNNVSTRIGSFSDLQLAYLHVKSLIDDPPWFMLSWEDTIRKLKANHLEDRSGLDFATHGRSSYTIYYDDDEYGDMPGLVS